MVVASGLSRGSTRMGSKRRWVSRSTSTSPIDGTCVAGMVTGPAGQGDVAETVLGIVGVVVVPVVVTVDEATLGLAARITVMATAATAPILRTERIMAPTVVTVVAGSDVRAPDDHEDLTA